MVALAQPGSSQIVNAPKMFENAVVNYNFHPLAVQSTGRIPAINSCNAQGVRYKQPLPPTPPISNFDDVASMLDRRANMTYDKLQEVDKMALLRGGEVIAKTTPARAYTLFQVTHALGQNCICSGGPCLSRDQPQYLQHGMPAFGVLCSSECAEHPMATATRPFRYADGCAPDFELQLELAPMLRRHLRLYDNTLPVPGKADLFFNTLRDWVERKGFDPQRLPSKLREWYEARQGW